MGFISFCFLIMDLECHLEGHLHLKIILFEDAKSVLSGSQQRVVDPMCP